MFAFANIWNLFLKSYFILPNAIHSPQIADFSFNKFNNYEHWRDYFLEPTLENAHELLRDNGFLLWNIADVDGYTLEYDSCDILEALEMKSVETIKMVMGTKNVDKHLGVAIDNGNFKKYENIFVYKKVIETTTDSVNNVNYKDEKAS